MWWHRPTDETDRGAQIDLVIDPKDACINLCEMKLADGEVVIDKRYAAELRNKRAAFRRVTGTNKALILTLVTAHGVRPNLYQREIVDQHVGLDALFAT